MCSGLPQAGRNGFCVARTGKKSWTSSTVSEAGMAIESLHLMGNQPLRVCSAVQSKRMKKKRREARRAFSLCVLAALFAMTAERVCTKLFIK